MLSLCSVLDDKHHFGYLIILLLDTAYEVMVSLLFCFLSIDSKKMSFAHSW